jgi:hypothetical protein
MAYVKTQRLVQFLAKVDGGGSERVLGMQVTYMDRFTDGADVKEFPGNTAPVDFAGLVALMHPTDQDLLKAALDAAVAARP